MPRTSLFGKEEPTNRVLGLGIALVLAVAVSAAYAGHGGKEPTAEEERIKACATQATDKRLKGDERKAFMSECFQTQREQMTACDKDATAKNLKGDERRAFMSQCLKADKKS
jgi:uncharacterized protein HemX